MVDRVTLSAAELFCLGSQIIRAVLEFSEYARLLNKPSRVGKCFQPPRKRIRVDMEQER